MAAARSRGGAHRDDAVQARQIARSGLLRVGQALQIRRGADQVGQPVLLDGVEHGSSVELGHDDDLAAHVEHRVRAGAVVAAPVEPRRHVERAVVRVHREVHDDVVRGEHLVEARERNGLRHAGGARGEQAARLVPGGAVGRGGEDGGLLGAFGVVDVDGRAQLVERVGGLAGGQAEVHGGAHGAQPLRGDVQEGELGAVGQLVGDDVSDSDAVGGEAGHETARIGAQLGVGPDAAAGQIRHGRAVRVAVRIAFKAGGPGESALDDLAQGRRVVVGVGGLDGQRHLRPSSC